MGFYAKEINRKNRDQLNDIHMVFTDYKKAFDQI